MCKCNPSLRTPFCGRGECRWPYRQKVGVRDWPEDFVHENGEYMNTCHSCGETFIGYKRRVTCKVCATAPATLEDMQHFAAHLKAHPEEAKEFFKKAGIFDDEGNLASVYRQPAVE